MLLAHGSELDFRSTVDEEPQILQLYNFSVVLVICYKLCNFNIKPPVRSPPIAMGFCAGAAIHFTLDCSFRPSQCSQRTVVTQH